MTKSGRLRPGQRFLIVRGGLEEGPVQIVEVSKREFDKLGIATIKEPINENAKSEFTLQGTTIMEQEEEIGVPTALNEAGTTLVQMS